MAESYTSTYANDGEAVDAALQRADSAAQPDADITWTGQQTCVETKETVYALTGTSPAIDPANGTIQTWTVSDNSTRTPTEALESGQSVTLMVDLNGTAAVINWPTMVWAGGSAQPLAASGYSVIVLWKVDTTLYGLHAGDMS